MILPSNVLKNRTQIIGISIAGLSMMNYGLHYAWPSPATSKLTRSDSLHLTCGEASYFTVLSPIATILSSAPVGAFVKRFGRRVTLILGAIPYLVAWTLIAVGGSKWTLYTARIMSGVGDSCTICASSLYVGEIARPNVRGTWGNLPILQLSVGVLLSYTLGGYLDVSTAASVCAIFPTLQFVLTWWIPESPYYLLAQERHEHARKSLEWFRQTRDTEAEFVVIWETLNEETSVSGEYIDILMNPAHRRALLAVVLLRMTQQFSGISALITHFHGIFQTAGSHVSPTTSSIICGGVQLIFYTVGSLIVSKLGRRKTMLSSATCSILVLSVLSVYFYVDATSDVDVSQYSWIPLAGTMVYFMGYGLGLAVLPTLISGELFASSIKEISSAINNIAIAILIAGTTKLFQLLAEIELYVPFAFFACTCALLTVWCYFLVPETNGKTLGEIQLEFQLKLH